MTSVPLPGKIGRYQILERVGRGGMGELYRAFDPVLDREVAVKVMLADFSGDTEQMRPRFYREAKAAAKLQHRNIVTVFEFAEEANQPHIVMEFLRGIQLGSRMSTPPPLTLGDKLDIVAQLCGGLGYAHSQGVVHRDVKPANVFILADGTVKLLDFGIAKLATSTLTQQGDVLGSASYMSPEQVSGNQNLDGRSDVWSTGVLLFELLSGRRPFEGDALTAVIVGILKEDPPSLDAIVPGLPAPLVAAVARALEKDPQRRTATAEELGRELQRIRQGLKAASSNLQPMAETRYASTNVLKALHDDRQKQGTAAIDDRTLEGMAGAPAPVVLPRPGQSKTWIIAAGVAAVIVAAVAVWAWRGSSPPPVEPSVATQGVPGQAAPPPGAVTTPQPAKVEPPTVARPIVSTVASPPEVPGKQVMATPTRSAPAREAETPTGTVAAAPALAPPAVKTAPAPTPPAAPPPEPAPVPARPVVMVTVVLSAPYAFAVMDGSRMISAPALTHELPQLPNGKTLRLAAPEVFLDQAVRVDGGEDGRFEYSPPGLGRLVIRARRGDCRVLVGKRDLGFGPWPPVPAVAGDYQVSLACPDGQNPVMSSTVTPGFGAQVFFKD